VDTRSAADATEEARGIVTTRMFDAPRDLVFEAWTDPKHLAQWWGPTGFTTTTSAFEMRPGGVWRFVMHGPDGTDYQNRITFIDVKRPSLLTYRHGGGEDVEPVQFEVTVTFEDLGSKTRLTMRALFPTAAARDKVVEKYGAIEGARQTLARLAAHLSANG
jgi:uncharacterized protein YndB with AHSA1/START domain